MESKGKESMNEVRERDKIAGLGDHGSQWC